MALFFKPVWTECLGEDPKCPKYLNKERLPPYKSKCGGCGGKAREISKPDGVRLAAAGVVLAIAASLGWWSVRPRIAGTLPTPAPGVSLGGGEARPGLIAWAVEAQKSGVRERFRPDQFESKDGVARLREPMRAGDRVRFEVTYSTARLYAFHRNRTEATRIAVDAAGRVTLPGGDQWYELDSTPGDEEFLLIAAKNPVAKLEKLPEHPEPAVVDQEFRAAGETGGVDAIRVVIPHRQ